MLGRVIELDGPTKEYRSRVAVDDLSLAVQPGRVTGFLGPDGSGKTTTLRCIVGLTHPTAGSALILGRPYPARPADAPRRGALIDPRAPPLADRLRPLLVLARSNGLPARRVDEVTELVGLESVAYERMRGFSLGMGQRLGIGVALLGDPDVLLLAQPTTWPVGTAVLLAWAAVAGAVGAVLLDRRDV